MVGRRAIRSRRAGRVGRSGALAAAVPFAPLLGVVLLLAGLTLGSPPDPAGPPLATAAPERSPPRFVTPTTLATAVAWDRTALELSAASSLRRPTWYVVANTAGVGVYLRASPKLSDRRQVLAEGTLLLEVSAWTDPTWKHVWVAPNGPGGWVPSRFVVEMP